MNDLIRKMRGLDHIQAAARGLAWALKDGPLTVHPDTEKHNSADYRGWGTYWQYLARDHSCEEIAEALAYAEEAEDEAFA